MLESNVLELEKVLFEEILILVFLPLEKVVFCSEDATNSLSVIPEHVKTRYILPHHLTQYILQLIPYLLNWKEVMYFLIHCFLTLSLILILSVFLLLTGRVLERGRIIPFGNISVCQRPIRKLGDVYPINALKDV